MSHKKCAVLGCEITDGKMFRLPQRAVDETRLQEWILALGNPELLTLPKNKLKNKTVCWIHFDKKYILQNKLSTTAVPTLHLPEPIIVPDINE